MSEVKKVTVFAYLEDGGEPEVDYHDDPDGKYVLASDYDALAAKFNDPEYPPKHSRRLIEQLRTERDAALAELAALKGGQEAVAMIRYARGVPGFENEMPHVVSCNDLPDGLYPVYLAPPAQASAWVPEWWKLVPVEPTTAMIDVAVSHALMVSLSSEYNWSSYMRDVWLRMLAAAPTPGASDGKGGKP